jgi:hypothetical protein
VYQLPRLVRPSSLGAIVGFSLQLCLEDNVVAATLARRAEPDTMAGCDGAKPSRRT